MVATSLNVMLTLAKVDPNQARVQAGQALSDQGGSNPPVGTKGWRQP